MILSPESTSRDIAEHIYGIGEVPRPPLHPHARFAIPVAPPARAPRRRWVFVLPIAAILACTAIAALAEPQTYIWPGSIVSGGRQAWVALDDPHDPAAEASVTFHNEMVHGGDEVITLTHNGLTVTLRLLFQADSAGAERIEAEPPDGYVARPHQITVPEGATQVLHIYRYRGL